MVRLMFKKDLLEKKGEDTQPEAKEFVQSNEGKQLKVVGIKIEGCDLYFNAEDFEVFKKEEK